MTGVGFWRTPHLNSFFFFLPPNLIFWSNLFLLVQLHLFSHWLLLTLGDHRIFFVTCYQVTYQLKKGPFVLSSLNQSLKKIKKIKKSSLTITHLLNPQFLVSPKFVEFGNSLLVLSSVVEILGFTALATLQSLVISKRKSIWELEQHFSTSTKFALHLIPLTCGTSMVGVVVDSISESWGISVSKSQELVGLLYWGNNHMLKIRLSFESKAASSKAHSFNQTSIFTCNTEPMKSQHFLNQITLHRYCDSIDLYTTSTGTEDTVTCQFWKFLFQPGLEKRMDHVWENFVSTRIGMADLPHLGNFCLSQGWWTNYKGKSFIRVFNLFKGGILPYKGIGIQEGVSMKLDFIADTETKAKDKKIRIDILKEELKGQHAYPEHEKKMRKEKRKIGLRFIPHQVGLEDELIIFLRKTKVIDEFLREELMHLGFQVSKASLSHMKSKSLNSKGAREAETPRIGWPGTGQSEDSIGGQNLANHRILFKWQDSEQSEHRIQMEYYSVSSIYPVSVSGRFIKIFHNKNNSISKLVTTISSSSTSINKTRSLQVIQGLQQNISRIINNFVSTSSLLL
ncbi:hypothetical protein VP01_3284g1 [Puccinia sorghi]|uniref:Uncharacterized protein n=1 Tax=Puccinia sorghi TaxID=27349 RepID=A0A0L6UXM4_9BASI|nr:hypothetical protein VP01_3284g1 [Puccinia sorghi]